MEIPSILDRVASAGSAWLDLDGNPVALQDIELCRAWGYPVEIAGGKARLARDPDLLVPAWIEEEAGRVAWRGIRVRGFLETGSTNDEALALARADASEGTVVLALRQTAGRGRLGRKWISPAGSGIYFSLILRPRQALELWPALTLAAAVALCRAVQDLRTHRLIPTELDVELKWPNDILLSGKKAAGILLETAFKGESAVAAVVGVGINVSPASVPADLSGTATAIGCEAGFPVPRRRLLIRFLTHFKLGYHLFGTGCIAEIIEQWKSCSTMWDGVEVTVHDGDRARSAVTCGLTEGGALRIRTEAGGEETLLAGDVSIRRR